MKTWSICIIISIVFVGMGLGAISKPQTVEARPGPQALDRSLVQIVRTWEKQKGSVRVTVEEMSLGTVIGTHRILTHNHFTGGLGTQPNETLSIVDQAGRIFPASISEVKGVALDKSTLLLDVPATLTTPPAVLADQQLIGQLAPNAWLTVDYWDDANSRFATKAFQVLQQQGGIVILADPEHIINLGDSGGSAYFEGRLIGNTKSYNADMQRNALGSFNVALVPAQISAQ